MKVCLIKEGDGRLKPAYPQDHEVLKKLKMDQKVTVKMEKAGRSIELHRMFFAFLQFLFENQEGTNNFDKFRAAILLNLDHTETSFRRLNKGDYEEVTIPKSLSFDKTSQKELQRLTEGLKNISNEVFGINFDDWYKSEWSHESSCEVPNCHEPHTDTHEIFPGHGRREYCIKKGWQIKLCRTHHKKAHGIFEKHSESYNTTQYETMKLFCKIKKINIDEAMREIMSIKKQENEDMF